MSYTLIDFNTINTLAITAYSFASSAYDCFTPDKDFRNDLNEIETLAKSAVGENRPKNDNSFEELSLALNKLCGTNGYSEINTYQGNYQIQLFCKTEKERKAASTALAKLFDKFQISNQFDDWQYEKTENFALKLSSNQTAALLALDPKYDASYKVAQNVLKGVKRANDVVLTTLPHELLDRILSQLSIPEVGRSGLVCKKFATLTQDPTLWRNIAALKNVPLKGDETTKQIIDKVYIIRKAVISLKLYPDPNNHFSGKQLAYLSQKQIEEKNGICLTPNQNQSDNKLLPGEDKDYVGIVVLEEKTPQGDKWFLHLCPGGGYSKFKREDFEHLMPIAIKKLEELKIKPEYLSHEIGRHSGNTFQCFQVWQASQK